ncbi:DUF2752 domain-containing protein [Allobranchiibius sp. GilTou73]|uniref:DUF2752 domain-containing protein n=1 Tax=Allobranchiibius sp. GilTou73 TaxID=2904523 RepID=UPI001F1C4DC3|nr:DUF2752 domain-containing protein [Allobranchiibius sp. GilTou73]UIJ34475.1 DUF2752 domain-containing protein [Allobranchiibius sp. GilTou73]
MTQLGAAPAQSSTTYDAASRDATSPWRRVRPLAVGGLLVGVATVALHFRDPHQHGSWGMCPLYALTGIYCPGCGGLRAVNDLTNGNLRAALSSNVFVVLLMPVVVGWWLTALRNRWRGVPSAPFARQHATVLTYVIGAVAVIFMIVRNTPWGAALAP